MQVRAKFRCGSITKHDGGVEEVKLHAVRSGSDDNAQWSKYTPSGDLSMHITAEGAQGVFVPGQEYYLDITPA